jgi:hypothetical protein
MTEFTLPISTSHVVNDEALDSWIVMYTGRDNKVNVEMESDYSYKIAVDIHEDKKAYGMYIFDFESSSMWMILIRLKMMLITSHHNRRIVPIGTYLDFDMSQCRTDFKHTADNLSSSFRAFYASVNGIICFKTVIQTMSIQKNHRCSLSDVEMLVIKESSIVNFESEWK